MRVIITEGYSDCETCGWYEWGRVECSELNFKAQFDNHTSGGPSIEESLQKIIELMGHEVLRVQKDH